MGVGNHHVHHAVRGHGVFPCKRFIDTCGSAVFAQAKVIWPMGESQVWSVKCSTRSDFAVRFGVRCCWLGVGWFEPHAARRFNRAEHDLQNV